MLRSVALLGRIGYHVTVGPVRDRRICRVAVIGFGEAHEADGAERRERIQKLVGVYLRAVASVTGPDQPQVRDAGVYCAGGGWLRVCERHAQHARAQFDYDVGAGSVGGRIVNLVFDRDAGCVVAAQVCLAAERQMVGAAPIGLESCGVVDGRRPRGDRANIEKYGLRIRSRPAVGIDWRGGGAVRQRPWSEHAAQIDEGAGARALAGLFDLDADLSAKVLSRGAGAQHEDREGRNELARQRCHLYAFLPPKTKSLAAPAFRWQLAHLAEAAGGVI